MYIPAEWADQEAVQLTWPHAHTDWRDTLQEVAECYINIAREISMREQLWIVTPEPNKVKSLLNNYLPGKCLAHISYFKIDSNDTWARDHGFITALQATQPTSGSMIVRHLLDFKFNAWGGKFQAEKDNAINRQLFEQNAAFIEDKYVDNLDFELEGGSIDSDGQGTILTTAQCNLNPNRRTDSQTVEQELLTRLHAKRILWLHHGGLEHDDTDAHIDTLARFCPNDTIVYCSGNTEMEAELRTFRTLEDKPYNLVAILPYYANFLIINGAVLVPFYENEDENEQARQTLKQVFPDREIIGVDCRILLTQNGSLHCCTMQYPAIL